MSRLAQNNINKRKFKITIATLHLVGANDEIRTNLALELVESYQMEQSFNVEIDVKSKMDMQPGDYKILVDGSTENDKK
jgi:hypothetical protein